MNARLILFFILVSEVTYQAFRLWITEKHRKLPLPIEVSDIFEPERYKTYLEYTKEKRYYAMIRNIIDFVINLLLIFSPFFTFMETICNQNVYSLFLMTYGLLMAVNIIEDYIFSYISTFKIEEKYGLNKKDRREFHRGFFIDEVTNLIITTLLYLLVIYICEHLEIWTHHFQISTTQGLIITSCIALALIIFMLLASVLSLIVLKTQYTFTPLEDGVLKNKINELQASCKKKVKSINIYNESKKSTTKNAFLLRFLWIREFGIADNFMEDNSERELLAVLSHEIGHLKHKKTLWNYLSYLFFIIAFCMIAYAISNAKIILDITHWVNASFQVTRNNYYLLILFYANLFKPFDALTSVYISNVTRSEEYEADREAVKNGFGMELINTFKRISNDQLVNVYPSPIIEFLEYDHPGMYQRIKAIQIEEERISKKVMDK